MRLVTLILTVLCLMGCTSVPAPKPVYWRHASQEDWKIENDKIAASWRDAAKKGLFVIGGDLPCGQGMSTFTDFQHNFLPLNEETNCGWISDENPPRYAIRYVLWINGVESDVAMEEYEAEVGSHSFYMVTDTIQKEVIYHRVPRVQ